ncbi:hypothetical protein QQF64_021868 [Cirrhinus molitorella]|uniref:Uncharacterized protein n=1 Tax=Cirrhinus molitorella TaxID=172907 RepID=A0ABR3L871_9TELE
MNNQSLVSTCGTERRVAVTSSVLRFIKAARITTYYNVLQFYLVCASGCVIIKSVCEFGAEGQTNLRRAVRAVSPNTRITILFEEVIPPALSAKCTIRSFPQTSVLPFRRGYISQAKQKLRKSRVRGTASGCYRMYSHY